MKKIRNIIILAALAAMLPAVNGNVSEVSAASKEDVIAAAREAGFSEVYVQQGINYLESHPEYTSAQYDQMIAEFKKHAENSDSVIDQYLQMYPDAIAPVLPSEPEMQEPDDDFVFELDPEAPSVPAGDPVQQAPSQETSGSTPSQNGQSVQESKTEENKPAGGNSAGNVSDKGTAQAPQKNYADMTPEEQKAYRDSLSQSQKNQILKDLPKEKQLEIINGLIDASSAFGMNVTVDELSKDSINYSIRDDDGKIVDISSMGVIVDDTGFDYTALIAGSAAVILLSSAGLAFIAAKQRKNN